MLNSIEGTSDLFVLFHSKLCHALHTSIRIVEMHNQTSSDSEEYVSLNVVYLIPLS